MSRYILYLKGKTAKTAGSRTATRKEKRKAGGRGDARPCVPPSAVVVMMASPWWPLALPVRSFTLRCALISFGASIWAANFANFGSFWASFAALLDLLCHQGSFFLQLLGSIHMNLQSKLEKAKTSVIGEIGA